MIISLVYGQNKMLSILEEILGEKIYECRDKETALKYMPEAEIVITIGGGNFALPMDEDLVKCAYKLKWVFSISAGVERLPIEELKSKGVIVNNTSGVHAGAIAEYVLGGLLMLSHHFHKYYKDQLQSIWGKSYSGENLEEKTMCIIGAGNIGKEIGKKAKAFDMNVIGLKRTPTPLMYFDQVLPMDKLEECLGIADYVVLVTPLTEETYHIMNESKFQLMKSSAVFVNVSRGDTVEESALISALQNKQIGGAVLDVFHEEPLADNSPLWNFENVIITPHASGISKNTTKRIIKMFRDSYNCYRNQEELPNQF